MNIPPSDAEVSQLTAALLAQAREHRAAGRAGEAKVTCLRLLQINDRDPDALVLLGDLEFQAGNTGHAEIHLRSALALAPDHVDAHERLAAVLVAQGRQAEAAACHAEVLRLAPDYPESQNRRGLDLQGQGLQGQALDCYRKAIAVSPTHAPSYFNQAVALGHLGQTDASIDSYQEAIRIRPDYPIALCNLGVAYKSRGQLDTALACYQKALEGDPQLAVAHNNLGSAYRDLGRFDEAIASFRRAIDLDPGLAEAHRQLADMKTFTSQDKDVEALIRNYQQPDVRADQKMLYAFALAKAMEDLQDYDAAFGYLQSGNRLKRQSLDFSIAVERQRFENLKALFSKDLFDHNTTPGATDPAPIFIVGMPRSGTTLVEQILSSHRNVYGAGELNALRQAVSDGLGTLTHALLQGQGPGIDPARFVKTGDRYLELLQAARELQGNSDPDVRHVTDKMPDNFRLIGLIRLILPNARVIHCTRDPMATCLSIYKRLFAVEGLQFSYDLGELGHYYNLYRDLMAHWRSALPGFIYDVSYEDLVADQETCTRALVSRCGLDWDPNCLRFEKSARPVQTASATQVRKPIYTRSLALWQKYEAHLKPLKDALEG